MNSLHQVWLKLAQCLLEKKIFSFPQCISAISLIFPPEKGPGRSFEQTWIHFEQGCFVPCLVNIGPVVLEKKMKMWKIYTQTTSHKKSSLQLSAQLSWKVTMHIWYRNSVLDHSWYFFSWMAIATALLHPFWQCTKLHCT